MLGVGLPQQVDHYPGDRVTTTDGARRAVRADSWCRRACRVRVDAARMDALDVGIAITPRAGLGVVGALTDPRERAPRAACPFVPSEPVPVACPS